MDKVYALPNLSAAWAAVRANAGAAGVDHQTIEHYEREWGANLKQLAEQLRDGSYVPPAVRRVWIPKPGSREERPLGIPTVRDRVVQTALRNVLEPIFEMGCAAHSYGFRPGRGCQDALREECAETERPRARADQTYEWKAAHREIITQLNLVLRGWYEYFKHSHRTTWERFDRWIRMRLRSVLRQRHRGKGRVRGRDQLRWPNAFFRAQGLFNLGTVAASKGHPP